MSGPLGVSHKSLPSMTAGQIIVANASNIPTAVTLSGDGTLSDTGVLTITNGSHAHDAGDITTGTFDAARIPTLTLSKISDAGTMAAQNANAVAITGGTINGTTIGATTATTGAFTTVSANSGSSTTSITGTGSTGIGIQGTSAGSYGVFGTSTNSYGIYGTSTNDIGVAGVSTNSIGVAGNSSTNISLRAYRNAASPSAVPVFYVLQDHASDTNTAALIRNDGTGDILRLSASQDSNVLWSVTSSGLQTTKRLDSGTNDTQNVLVIGRNSSGTPAANFASRQLWQLESSTTENQDAAGIVTSWVVATHASRTARQVFNIYDTAAREAMRLEASGSAPMIGFLGAAAVIRQALGAWAGLTTDQKLDAFRDALTNLGLTSYT